MDQAEQNTMPDFFIIGAAKAGSTSLHDFLSRHPDVCMSTIKEPNFFSHQEISEQELYYPKKDVKTADEYSKLFKDCKSGQLKGESSVSYLFYPGVASKIKQAVPNAKIIAILRDPISRAVSHYNMDKNLGLVKAELTEIFQHPDKYPLHYQQYFQLGNYYKLLKRYVDTFPSDQIKILYYDNLRSDETELIATLCDFLGIDATLAGDNVDRSNVTARPRSKFLQDIYASHKMRAAVKAVLPGKLKQKVIENFFERNPSYKLSDNFKEELRDYFHKDLESLRTLVGPLPQNWLA